MRKIELCEKKSIIKQLNWDKANRTNEIKQALLNYIANISKRWPRDDEPAGFL